MAGFEVITYGRFWVIAEADKNRVCFAKKPGVNNSLKGTSCVPCTDSAFSAKSLSFLLSFSNPSNSINGRALSIQDCKRSMR
jgi:hypothetical protein